MNGRTNAEDMAARTEWEILSIRMGVVELRDRGMEIAARFLEQALDAKLGVDSRQETTPAEVERLRAAGSRWIQVAERWPENGQWCWVWWHGLSDPFQAMRDKRAIGGWRNDEWEDFARKVTHWMPREPTPEPPTAETPLSGRAAAEDDAFTGRIRAGGDDAVAAMNEYMEIRRGLPPAGRRIYGIVDAFGLRRWIPVAERVPETYDDVLGGHMHEDGSFTYRIAYRQFGTNLIRFYDKHDQMLGVTHWMPLPPPPSSESQSQ